MTCPSCSQNNFKWARRCDHCGRPLTGAAAPVSAGAPARNERGQSAVDIEGRTFTFNGVSYTALARSRQLKDADVYPLRHQQSELVVFEMKAFRCDPGSPLYEDVKGRPAGSFRTKAMLSTSDTSAAHLVIEEIYEQDGRLLGLQRAYREHPGPAYHEARMASAEELFQKRQFSEAVAVYDAVLALNPHHAVALQNKGLALMNGGKAEGLLCFEQCVGIDANMAEPQINQASYLAVMGKPEQATSTLARLLKRYPWSFDHWLALVHMASTEDTLDLAEHLIEPGLAALAGVPVGDRVRAAMDESRTRWRAYVSELERARSQQMAQQWADALETLTRCSTLSRRHAVASLNRAICLYHLSDMKACRDTLRPNYHRLLDKSHGLASMLLWMLSAASLGDWQEAMAFVSAFEQHIGAGLAVIEMPRVPVAAMPSPPPPGGSLIAAGSVLEAWDVAPILTALTALAARPECQAKARTIVAVMAAYTQLASL
jgi:tetratricopeptide (TPR) repeat protein